ncbi:MAG: GNAT family N-acetyltransferase [Patescibacteria group bacterium]
MKIIEFDPEYAQEIYDFVMDIKVNDLGWKKDAFELHDIKNNYLSRNGNFWIALEADKIIGTLALKDMGNNQGYLKRMYIDQEYRGKGLAQAMINILLKYAKEKRFEEIYLATTRNPVSERAIAFYKKYNFESMSKLPDNFTDDDDNVFMRLKI